MNSMRKYSLAAGIFYLLTFVSIPTLALYRPVRGPNFVAGPGPDSPVILGALLEMIVALAGIGTAVALWEFSLGIYLTFWGFKAAPILPENAYGFRS
jgi:hypothetical protein